MLVAGIAALGQDRNAAPSGFRIGCMPDRELPIVARRPGERDQRRRLSPERVKDDRALCCLDALWHGIEKLDPRLMEWRSLLYDQTPRKGLLVLHKRARREFLAPGHQLHDVIFAECAIELGQNRLKCRHGPPPSVQIFGQTL